MADISRLDPGIMAIRRGERAKRDRNRLIRLWIVEPLAILAAATGLWFYLAYTFPLYL
jgi:hypothetical protein